MLESLAKQVQDQFIQQGWTLSLAESCTGGGMAACLTRVAGCSQYFMGSLVTYSNELKQKVLGVSPKTLAQFGAVSQETAEEMVKGLLAVTNTDVGVAITGIAGPTGGSVDKPIGTVWIAIGKKSEVPKSFKLNLAGSRVEIMERSIQAVLEALVVNSTS